MRALIASGRWTGCPGKECVKGTVLIETRERCVLVTCPTCDGRGYLQLWKMTDKTKARS